MKVETKSNLDMPAFKFSLCAGWSSEFAKLLTFWATDSKLRAFLRYGKINATATAETMAMRDNIQFRITFDEMTLAGWTGTIKSGSCQSVVITSPACIESRLDIQGPGSAAVRTPNFIASLSAFFEGLTRTVREEPDRADCSNAPPQLLQGFMSPRRRRGATIRTSFSTSLNSDVERLPVTPLLLGMRRAPELRLGLDVESTEPSSQFASAWIIVDHDGMFFESFEVPVSPQAFFDTSSGELMVQKEASSKELGSPHRQSCIDRLDFDIDNPDVLEIGDYREASDLVRASKLTSVNSPDLLAQVKFLNPVTFRHIVASEAQLGTDTASAIPPIILSTIQLRRVKGEAILVQGTKVIIG
ncbi:hypothetical protein V500_10624 [Pseudogymnoascus sp. VKM F-4518 (FW-2643)]|nr:hypothetical protein V500_10624 [Pseudogymnoascus sp. VKM F-4518 (FW-2643)]